MCWNSEEHLTRRAVQNDQVVIGTHSGHMGKGKVMREAAGKNEGICLLTGDRVQFQGLHADFQKTYAVGPNAVAFFVQDEQTRTDFFDFNNGERVALHFLYKKTKFRVLELAGQQRPETRSPVEQAEIGLRIEEGALVGVATGISARSSRFRTGATAVLGVLMVVGIAAFRLI